MKSPLKHIILMSVQHQSKILIVRGFRILKREINKTKVNFQINLNVPLYPLAKSYYNQV